MDYKVAAIVVTFNRKELLKYCLEAIVGQDYRPTCVYIIDNASTDGTDVWVKEYGYDGAKNGIDFEYVRLEENIGGSGGFYTGMKMAHESKEKYDAFWLMDDDGIPDKKQLYYLVSDLQKHDYLSPLVVSKEDPSVISYDGSPAQQYVDTAEDNLIIGAANPFNGVLYSRRLVDKIGYPIRDMFIWGDEINYGLRSIKAGFPPAMDVRAIHVHPRNRQPFEPFIGKSQIIVPKDDWKLYCLVRNLIYNARTLSRTRHYMKVLVQLWCKYSVYFTFIKFNVHKLMVVNNALMDGSRKDLSKLSKYKKS